MSGSPLSSNDPRVARRRHRAAAGVTLLEMMVVVAILGIIAALSVPNLAPVVQQQRLASSADEVAGFLERARRLAVNEGRCYRVYQNGSNLEYERRSSANCGYCDADGSNCNSGLSAGSGWDGVSEVLKPQSGVTFTLAVTTGIVTGSLIFRPNSGRVVGNGDLDISDDGGRVLVEHPKLNRHIQVLVQSNGRVCTTSRLGAAPALATPVTCGTGFTGAGSGSGGDSCGAVGTNGSGLFGLVLLSLLGVRRRRARARATTTTTTTTTTTRAPRGYLLIEVMIGGAILAVILGAAMSIVADSRAEITRASHRAKASSLGHYYLQQLLAAPQGATSACPTGGPTVPGFTVSCSVANATTIQSASVPTLSAADEVQTVTVTVTYPKWNGSGYDSLVLVSYKRDRT